MQPALSIIIPTHERADTLARCLGHIAEQTIADQLEVIVVSDGHDDATTKLSSKHQNVRFIEIQKSQQGTARNGGVDIARAPLVLFIGDDIFLEKHSCEEHLDAHERVKRLAMSGERSAQNDSRPAHRYPLTAILGYTTWDPAIGITPVMRWLESSGWQFGYPLLKTYKHQFVPVNLQHRFTYTSHLSLPTDVARDIRFRKDVSLYGWEDIEWGWRLREAGVRLLFEPDARALHHHHITLPSSLRRMETLGASIVQMEMLVAGFDRLPKGWKRVAYTWAAMLPTMAGRHRKAFLQGMRGSRRTIASVQVKRTMP
jgi:GT2 family glycosyltransferase